MMQLPSWKQADLGPCAWMIRSFAFCISGYSLQRFFFLGTGNRCKKAEKVPDCMGITNLEKEIEVDLRAKLFHTGIPTRKTTHHRMMLREVSEVIVPQ